METNMKDKNQEKKREDQEQKGGRIAEKQDQPRKNHGVPEDPEEARNRGLGGAENFKRNMGCGG